MDGMFIVGTFSESYVTCTRKKRVKLTSEMRKHGLLGGEEFPTGLALQTHF